MKLDDMALSGFCASELGYQLLNTRFKGGITRFDPEFEDLLIADKMRSVLLPPVTKFVTNCPYCQSEYGTIYSGFIPDSVQCHKCNKYFRISI